MKRKKFNTFFFSRQSFDRFHYEYEPSSSGV
jgi:hypothetical protein